MRPYLLEMRQYMAPDHSAFIDALERGPSTREFVVQEQADFPELGDVYNDCLKELGAFRSKHFEYAGLLRPQAKSAGRVQPYRGGHRRNALHALLKKSIWKKL